VRNFSARSITVLGRPNLRATASALELPGTFCARRNVGLMCAMSNPMLAFAKRSSARARALRPS